MDGLEWFLWWFGMGGVFLSWILFLIFAQVTVRKLRKNTATRNQLGVEFMSGYDTFNVASALSTPRWLRKIFARSPLAFLAADYQTLYDNTSLFDRILARTFWCIFSLSGTMLILLLIFDKTGLFD